MSYSSSDPPTDRRSVALDHTEYYRLLASRRRRILLEILSERSTPITLEEISRAVTTRERDLESEPPPAVEEVTITLHHQHLPLLADAGIVDYRPSVTRVESFAGLERSVPPVERDDGV